MCGTIQNIFDRERARDDINYKARAMSHFMSRHFMYIVHDTRDEVCVVEGGGANKDVQYGRADGSSPGGLAGNRPGHFAKSV